MCVRTSCKENPPALEFSSSDLVWSKVEGWRDKKDEVAIISFPRVDDFLRVALIIYNQDKHVDRKGAPCHGPQDKMAAGTRVFVKTIMQRHNESVEKQGGPSNRDDLLTHRVIRRSIYELDADDADFSDVDPFTLGIQTEWQLQQMICFNNHNLIAF
ncbi:hypothetical protein DVH24_030751 [Malus domestica]|uniref:Uncharacterized protein n=1 Tax=Malus domestica TaxID=3750 RepID=A0A498HAD5_MALDO|nr:hypothetical protein DVH24_030751 [Malus domestica]